MTPDRLRPTRRQLLGGVAVGVTAIAGCVGGDDDGGNENSSDDSSSEVDEGLVINDEVVLNSAFPVRLADPDTEEVVANVHYHSSEFNHWHRMPLTIPLEAWVRYRVVVVDSEDEAVPLGPDGPLSIELEPAEDTPRDIVTYEIDGDSLDLYGRRPGTGDFVFSLVDDGERIWQGSLLSIRVDGNPS
jgi:hypothetical protein